jgi:membrane protein
MKSSIENIKNSVKSISQLNLFKVTAIAWKRFNNAQGFDLAAAISFYAILSFIPAILLVLSVFGYILGSTDNLTDSIVESVGKFFPAYHDFILSNIEGVIKARHTFGVFALISLYFAGSSVFNGIERVLKSIFGAPKPRGFFKSKLLSLVLIISVGIAFLLSIVLTAVFNFLRDSGSRFLGYSIVDFFLDFRIINWALSAFLIALSFILIVKILSHGKIPWKPLIIGSLFWEASWELARFGFGIYIHHSAGNFNVIYGPLGAVIIILTWIYYASTLFIISATVVSALVENQKGSSSNHS